MYILSGLIEIKDKLKRNDEVEILKTVSPLAWGHVNLYGKYEITEPKEILYVDETIDILGYQFIFK